MKIGTAKVTLTAAGLTRLNLELCCVLQLCSVVTLLSKPDNSTVTAQVE